MATCHLTYPVQEITVSLLQACCSATGLPGYMLALQQPLLSTGPSLKSCPRDCFKPCKNFPSHSELSISLKSLQHSIRYYIMYFSVTSLNSSRPSSPHPFAAVIPIVVLEIDVRLCAFVLSASYAWNTLPIKGSLHISLSSFWS